MLPHSQTALCFALVALWKFQYSIAKCSLLHLHGQEQIDKSQVLFSRADRLSQHAVLLSPTGPQFLPIHPSSFSVELPAEFFHWQKPFPQSFCAELFQW